MATNSRSQRHPGCHLIADPERLRRHLWKGWFVAARQARASNQTGAIHARAGRMASEG